MKNDQKPLKTWGNYGMELMKVGMKCGLWSALMVIMTYAWTATGYLTWSSVAVLALLSVAAVMVPVIGHIADRMKSVQGFLLPASDNFVNWLWWLLSALLTFISMFVFLMTLRPHEFTMVDFATSVTLASFVFHVSAVWVKFINYLMSVAASRQGTYGHNGG